MQFPPSSPDSSRQATTAAAAMRSDSSSLLPAIQMKESSLSPAPGIEIYNDGNAYPTPQPSSMAPAAPSSEAAIPPSSPMARIGDENASPIASPDDATHRRQPLSSVYIVRLSRNGGMPVTVGRSSKSANIAVNPRNKLVSRVHLRLLYNPRTKLVVVTCLGWNGLTVDVPTLTAPIYVAKDQMVMVEYQHGLSVNLRGDRVLVEMDEDETEEELDSPASPSSSVVMDSDIPDIDEDSLNLSQASVEDSPLESLQESSHRTGVFEEANNSVSQTVPEPCQETIQEGSSTSSEVLSNRGSRDVTAQPEVPEDVQEAEVKIKPEEVPKQALKLTSTETESTKTEGESTQKDAVSETTSAEGDVMAPPPSGTERSAKRRRSDVDLAHIVANHLAFSRLKSTPYTSLKASHKKLSAMSGPDFKLLLSNIPCVGVIKRQGKDAAGKPLEDEFYYKPEEDTDQDRRSLIEGNRGSIRQCRRHHVQYFWKPIPK